MADRSRDRQCERTRERIRNDDLPGVGALVLSGYCLLVAGVLWYTLPRAVDVMCDF